MHDTPSTIYRDRVPRDWPLVSLMFLDIDGPCNCIRTSPNGVKPHHPGMFADQMVGVDRLLIPHINRLSTAPHVLTVISSSWRNAHGLEQTEDTLHRAGWQGLLVGGTGIAQRRCLEISRFLAEWAADPSLPRVVSYVIVDDDESMGDLTDHLVNIHPLNGINDHDVVRALAMLFPSDIVPP